MGLVEEASALPASTPAAEGVAARGIHAFLDAIEAAPDIEPHSVMILRHGRLIAAGWWAPYSAGRKHLLYSLSKSFTSTAAGFAVAEGLLTLDDPVISYFPEFAADITDPRSRAMLVRHVASMASGHLTETLGRAHEIDPDELVRGFLLLPPDREPGTVFAYNQPATYTLATIVQKVSGQSLTEYLRPRLFDPLGIGEVAWVQDPPGRDVGFTGLHATTDAIARLGLLYQNGGVWQGKRLLSATWVAEATRAHIPTARATGAPPVAFDWEQGYGFQFWMSRHGYRGDGAYGQFCLVLPDQDAVIAMTAATENMQAVLDAVWAHLLPAFGDDGPLTGAGQEDEELRQRLTRLALPARPDAAALPSDWRDAEFTPAGGTSADQPSLTAVTVTRSGDGAMVRLTEGTDGSIDVRCDPAGWTSSGPEAPVPVAASFGRPAPDTLAVDVAFLETPHTLTVTCSRPDGTFDARWQTRPLDDVPLRRLCAPKPGG
jgi:CubicO group peptidase (beta-lactamase class C family)